MITFNHNPKNERGMMKSQDNRAFGGAVMNGTETVMEEMNGAMTEVARQRSSPMIVLFDFSGKVVHISSDLLELFTGKLPIEINDVFQDLKELLKKSNNGDAQHEDVQIKEALTIEKENYLCRGICLSNGNEITKAKFLIMLEKLKIRRNGSSELAKQAFCLSEKQMEIVNLLFKGYTNKEIANSLHIAEPTVKGHLQLIMAKMHVTTRTGILSKVVQASGTV
jgi:DNA-binding CsgD family transcriptional regulator